MEVCARQHLAIKDVGLPSYDGRGALCIVVGDDWIVICPFQTNLARSAVTCSSVRISHQAVRDRKNLRSPRLSLLEILPTLNLSEITFTSTRAGLSHRGPAPPRTPTSR